MSIFSFLEYQCWVVPLWFIALVFFIVLVKYYFQLSFKVNWSITLSCNKNLPANCWINKKECYLLCCIYVVASICSLDLSSGIFLRGPLWSYVTLVYFGNLIHSFICWLKFHTKTCTVTSSKDIDIWISFMSPVLKELSPVP